MHGSWLDLLCASTQCVAIQANIAFSVQAMAAHRLAMVAMSNNDARDTLRLSHIRRGALAWLLDAPRTVVPQLSVRCDPAQSDAEVGMSLETSTISIADPWNTRGCDPARGSTKLAPH
jgi:hypothetical protein